MNMRYASTIPHYHIRSSLLNQSYNMKAFFLLKQCRQWTNNRKKIQKALSRVEIPPTNFYCIENSLVYDLALWFVIVAFVASYLNRSKKEKPSCFFGVLVIEECNNVWKSEKSSIH